MKYVFLITVVAVVWAAPAVAQDNALRCDSALGADSAFRSGLVAGYEQGIRVGYEMGLAMYGHEGQYHSPSVRYGTYALELDVICRENPEKDVRVAVAEAFEALAERFLKDLRGTP